MQSRIVCICKVFLQSAFSNVSLNHLPQQMQSRIDCICKIFLQSVFLDVSLNDLPEQMLRSFSRWSFQMLPQGPLLSRCIAILATFPKIARKIVLLAIVGLPCLFPFHIIADRFQRRCVHPGDQYATVQTGKV